MRRSIVAAAAACALIVNQAWAGAACERPVDFAALRTAALQQEMMVAALACHAVADYNDFVLSHRAALQESDKALMAFFESANPRSGFDDYNLYKTELANSASMRSIKDGGFCDHARGDFQAAAGRTLEQALAVLPVDTGSVRCPLLEAAATVARQKMASEPAKSDWTVADNARE